MNTQDFLTDIEIAKIEAFCSDETMFEAVKKVVLAGIYSQGTIKLGGIFNPMINGAFNLASLAIKNPIPDEQLGQHIRSMWAGVSMMEAGFGALSGIKSEEKSVESPYNEAI